jgi:1-aminocyclopropane-1-carboxylate deaminase/D-cysteine desulfhydrase-like pyridoxal-dependent ACC family enzyme
MQEMAGRARAAGRTPYIIPESGATVVGALGYLSCGQEIVQQIRHGAPEFDTVAITAFSGGSQAGLLMARQLMGLRAEIVSIPIAWEAPRIRAYVTDVLEQAKRRFHMNVRVPDEICLLDGYQRHPGSLGRRICFIHTGGVFSIFPFRDVLSRLADA